MDYVNAWMRKDCHSYLAEHPTMYYIVLVRYEIAYLTVQFLLFCA